MPKKPKPAQHLNMQPSDATEQNIRRIAGLFPGCVTETKNPDGTLRHAIDFDKLRAELGEEQILPEGSERYEFTWPGKRQAAAFACRPVRAALRPCPKESVDFDNTHNLYIEGDNLDVLKLLRETYLGKVKMIYIDPPYNTGNDFIYKDDFKQSVDDYLAAGGQFDDQGRRLETNTETNGRYHTDWLNMIYPRLRLARELLTDDGVIFISIDDHEVENLKKVCNEVFGEKNFVAELIWKSKSGGANDSRFFAVDHEYVLTYAKNADVFNLNTDTEATVTTSYNRRDDRGEYALDRLDKQSIRYSPSLDYGIKGPDGKEYFPQHKDPNNPNATWRWGKETVKEKYDQLVFENGCIYTKNYKKDGAKARSLLIEDRFGRTRTGKTDCFELFGINLFSNPKPYKLVRFLEIVATDPSSLILDFFSGSATTAHAVMQLNAEDGGNRRFIMVQVPEPCAETSEAYKAGYKNICEIGKERIRRAGKKIREEQEAKRAKEGLFAQEDAPALDTGFRVLKLASTNMEDVYYQPRDVQQENLFGQVENVKPDRTPLDLLFQAMLELGITLDADIREEKIEGKTVFRVNDTQLVACFEEDCPESVVEAISRLKPLYAVVREPKDDAAMTNFDEIFKTNSPDTHRRII